MARPKQFDPDDVLDQAVEVFRDDGYDATTIATLSRRTGVGRQSLYDTFGDKDSLWALALARYRARQGEEMLTTLRQDDALTAIRSLLLWLIDDTVSDPRGCLVVAATAERIPADEDTTVQVEAQFEAIVDELRRVVERGQTDGVIDARLDARAEAELLLTVSQGLRVVGKVRPSAERLGPVVDRVVARLATSPAPTPSAAPEDA